MYYKFRLIMSSLYSLFKSFKLGLPGIKFDLFARNFALRGILKSYHKSYFTLFVHPISSLRYFEFDYSDKWVLDKSKLLDISSPYILPFYLAEKKNVLVTMGNPDEDDLNSSIEQSKLLKRPLNFIKNIDATKLPFENNSFDVITSISVLEHINGDGDSIAMREFVRVVKPGGRIIITFPVKGDFFEEFRSEDPYGDQEWKEEKNMFFFQRFYDEKSIESRLQVSPRLKLLDKSYFIEKEVGFFERYIQNWVAHGVDYIVNDSVIMAESFYGPEQKHPIDRMGNCMMVFEVEAE